MKPVPVLGSLLLLLLAVSVVTLVATGDGKGLVADHAGGRIVRGTSVAEMSQADGSPKDGHRCLDEVELRRIIREELAAHPVAIAVSQNAMEANVVAAPPSEADNKRRLERIHRQVDDYIQAGAISEAEMVAIEAEIAGLDKAGQREILSKIFRARNSGSLHASF